MWLVVIRVSPETATVLLWASLAVIVLALVVGAVQRFGRRGWIGVGVVVTLLLAVAGWSVAARKLALAEHQETRLAGVRGVVAAVQALAADTSPTTTPLRNACADVHLVSSLPPDGGVVVANATKLRPASLPLQHLERGLALASTLDPVRVLAPGTGLYDLPYDAERVGRSGHVLVLLDGSIAGGVFRGTVASQSVPSGVHCRGHVEVPVAPGRDLDDAEFLGALCRETGGPCGR